MNATYLKERFDQVQASAKNDRLHHLRNEAFNSFHELGIPTTRNEEWKYTRIGGFFNKNYLMPLSGTEQLSNETIGRMRLPGHETANEIFFINGKYSETLSVIRSESIRLMTLEEAAAGEFNATVSLHFGHSRNYLKDGINALNTAFTEDAVFLYVKKGKETEHPLYIYNVSDTRAENILAQPRSLIHLDENSQLQIVETFMTIGEQESFTNKVMEIVVEKAARLEYYQIQNDLTIASQVSSTHIRHVGKSYSNAVTVSLNGATIRNNLNVVMEADHCEAHLYGLYFQKGNSHIDNHTVVDNVAPHCYSNELYKGMLDGNGTGVFNGKIFVRQKAQKTNAFQSNRNILLSDTASINTKPQLEIFADDVKCSHGCTIGHLDDEALFYLQSRGVPERTAQSMLLQGFATDVLENIKCSPIRGYVDQLIAERLEI